MTQISRHELIFRFLVAEIESNGYPPTVREIGEAVGLASSSTVHSHLERMERDGLIRRDPKKPRAIKVIGEWPSEG